MKIKDVFPHIFIFICIGLFLSCLKNEAQGQDAAGEIFSKADYLLKVSLGYVKLKEYGKAEEALAVAYKLAHKIKEPCSGGIILYGISERYLKLDKFDNSFKAARDIDFPDVRYEAFVNIACLYVEQGKYQNALALIKEIEYPFFKALFLYRAVNRLTESELYKEALKIANTVGLSRRIREELITMQILDKNMLKKIEHLNIKEYSFGEVSSQGDYRKVKGLIDSAEEYCSLAFYIQTMKILFRASLLANQISEESLKQDMLYRIQIVHDRISRFEKALRATGYRVDNF